MPGLICKYCCPVVRTGISWQVTTCHDIRTSGQQNVQINGQWLFHMQILCTDMYCRKRTCYQTKDYRKKKGMFNYVCTHIVKSQFAHTFVYEQLGSRTAE